ncbi:MAG: alpha/beta hydrolase [Bacteroidetes bacterium]|nr:alpha/beta hydrolase [Bacteroidota bacterium]
MKTILIGEYRISFSIEGSGTPLVLIHGFCEDSSIWKDFSSELSKRFKIISVDLPGFGYSDFIPACSIASMADIVKAVLDELKFKKAVVIGHSMGGYVGISFAKNYPKYLLGLGMFHSHPFADPEEKKKTRLKAVELIRKEGHLPFARQLFSGLFAPDYAKKHPELIQKLADKAGQYSSESVINALVAMKDRPDNASVLKNIDCPVLFILGAEDNAVPADIGFEQTHLPNVADVQLLEEVGHMGMYEAKEKTLEIVESFVRFCVGEVAK